VTDKAFTAYDIQTCLYDAQRVEYLRAAIEKVVKPGDVVVDAGSGTGLLGLFAAQAGAARVYCLELNRDFIRVIEQNAVRNGLGAQVTAIHADATVCDLPEPVDVLVSEVISSGFFYEPQLQIVNNLRRFLKPGGKIVPMRMKNYVELISAQETLYGLTFNFDSRFTEVAGDRSLTSRGLYLATDFAAVSEIDIDATAAVTATGTGTATAVKITYDIEFTPGVWADKPTEFLLNPQIIFLPEPRPVREGEIYDISLRYLASDAPLTSEITVTPGEKRA
jgi:precorrin-6B methylase 2